MNIRDLRAELMTAEYAKEIAAWKYEGIYSVYNSDGDDEEAPLDGMGFVLIDDDGRVAAHFSFGADGRIPTVENYPYADDHLDIGLGLRPDLCGGGLGAEFVSRCLETAKARFGAHAARLTVAAFNQRAIRVYAKLGFEVERTVTHARSGAAFLIMRKAL